MKKSAVVDARYEMLSTMLRDRQTEIRSRLRSLREALPAEVSQVKDPEEQSMEDFVLGMDFALMEMESATLKKIDQALQFLEDGRYGICAECDESISEARLRALPFALLCRDCQENQESEEKEIARAASGRNVREEGLTPPPSEPRRGRSSGRSAPAPAPEVASILKAREPRARV